ncbi:integrator complex subunit 3 [Eucalyptus grandis]|uniref:integrator complex subunit 3 n=1 Tax=Eucalyptus grandis TaxID=71139 RepID=UPI00192E8865|nr:integrator complex subunit 3 [Eucalyptus grandis]XP_039163574.1 integrator complex subunit 3 [Eucalyptus grandis]XP_039163575.1 integrator complex subunit 3 [Eucalyptus grandis]XP_039163576.1 integrator complex subunit 3 [Eucalyptus grandis]
MASKLLQLAPHEAENPLELSLRQSFRLLEPELRPPFPLKTRTSDECSDLTRAILYGALTEARLARTHVKHLHAVVTDGYALFATLLARIVDELYDRLAEAAKAQVLWAAGEMVDVAAVGFGGLLVALLRQIVGGDFRGGNLWLCFEVVSLFSGKWSCLLEEDPLVLTSALYSFLRLLADHCRVTADSKLEALKRLEIEFCVKMLREQFGLCLKIGRDLIRLLQDLVHVPEFRAIWRDLVSNPREFGVAWFSDIAQIYSVRTSSRYFLLRLTPEAETQLRFLLTHVKLGSQKRHQTWFASKFFCTPERETLIVDIVRFVCCAHHPPREIIHSNVIPRWAVIGWLLKSCKKNYVEANAKLALFYDWLFFDERVDKVMNIEPALLLMVHSIPHYVELTHTLLEFLFLLVDNYDVERKDMISSRVSSSFTLLINQGLSHNLENLTSAEILSPPLKEKLRCLLSDKRVGIAQEIPPAKTLGHLIPMEVGTAIPEEHLTCIQKDEVGAKSVDASASIPSRLLTITSEVQENDIQKLVKGLGKAIKSSHVSSIQALEQILDLYMNVGSDSPTHCSISPEVLSSTIARELELNGYKLFAPLEHPQDYIDDDERESPTTSIIRKYLSSKNEKLVQLLLFWSRNGFPVGAHLLYYASRLAYEADMAKHRIHELTEDGLHKLINTHVPFLMGHIDCYLTFSDKRRENFPEPLLAAAVLERELAVTVVQDAFFAYRHYLLHLATIPPEEANRTLSELLVFDLTSCSEWKGIKWQLLFHGVFSQLSDLSNGQEHAIRLLVSHLNNGDIVNIKFEIGLKKLSILGENVETVLGLIQSSIHWAVDEQHKFWSLIRLELMGSQFQLEKLILKLFCSGEIDAGKSAIAVGGLLDLCCSRLPTEELVGAIMLLPNDVFHNFSATVLQMWAASHASMLFTSLAEFSKKVESINRKSIFSESAELTINDSAVLWLSNYCDAQGLSRSNIFGSFPQNTHEENHMVS